MMHSGSRVILRHIRQLTGTTVATHSTDKELLRRFAVHRDETAFALLVRRHGPLVFGVCRRVLHEEHDAEDVFQATFLILARKAGGRDWKESIGNWLYQVAYRLAVRLRRQAGRRQRHEQQAAPRHSSDPLAEITLREAQTALDEELNQLPQALRAPILLCCLEGETRDEAAQHLGWSVSTLKRRLERGRELLRVRLRRRGLTIPALLTGLTVAESTTAAVPITLITSTIQASAVWDSVTAGHATSAQSSLLVRAMLRSMWLRKVTTGLVIALASLGLSGVGAGLLLQKSSTSDDAQPKSGRAAVASPNPKPADSHGDPLPAGASVRLGSTRLRHTTGINSTAFALNGTVLIAAEDGGESRFWSASTGKEIRHLATGNPITVSPDGKTLASLQEKAVTLWDVATGQRLREFPREAGYVNGVHQAILFAPDGRTIGAISGEQSVAVWDVATGREKIHLPKHDKPIACIGFAADGKNVLTAVGTRSEDIVIRRWNAETTEELPTLRLPAPRGEIWLQPMVFSSDGNTIALEEAATASRKKGPVTNVFTEYRLRLVDVVSGRVIHRLDAEPEVVWSAGFSRNDQRVACQRMDGSVGVWNTATGASVFRNGGYPNNSRPDGTMTLAFTPDATILATGGDSGTIHLWDVAHGRERLPVSETHDGPVGFIVYAPDGKTVTTASPDHTIRLWDATTGRQRLLLTGHTAGVRFLALSPDGRTLASAGDDDTIRLWDYSSGKEVRSLKEKRQPRSSYTNYGVHGLVFSADGRTLTSWGEDQMLRVWDLVDGREASARKVRLQDVPDTVQSDSAESRSYARADWVHWCAFTADGKTLFLAYDKAVYVVDVDSGKEVFQLKTASPPSCLSLSPDGATLAMVGAKNTFCLFELATGKEVFKKTLQVSPHRAAFSADGRQIALARHSAPPAIIIVDVATGEETAKFDPKDANVDSLAFQPDGRALASGLSNGTTLLWSHAASLRRPKDTFNSTNADQLWTDLAGDDAVKARFAIWAMSEAPEQTLRLFRQRLRAAPAIDPKRIEGLIADLDDRQFARREAASRELKRLRVAADVALRAVLSKTSSAEMRQRVSAILAAPPRWLPGDPEALRRMRAVQVLGQIERREADSILEMLSQGEPAARETEVAKAALQRRHRPIN
jgi:RNA polymerase sigma factor (sigma-70 family)